MKMMFKKNKNCLDTVSVSGRIFDILNGAFMIFLSLICVYPLLYVAFGSFSDSNLLMAHSGILLKPLGFSTASYKMAFREPLLLTSYGNTIFIVVVGTLVNLVMSTLGAYVLSRKNLMWKKTIVVFITVTMFFSGGMIPTYLTVVGYGLNDSLWALILPCALNTHNMLVLRTAFAGVPESLEEAAKIDGIGHWTIMCKIFLPLVKPTLAVITLYYVVAHWNSWFSAAIYIRDRGKYPLQLVLRGILIQGDVTSMTAGDVGSGDMAAVSDSIKYAITIISTVPILCIYPFVQKYFVNGVMIGAVKG